VTKYPIKKIVLKEKGVSTLGARDIWFDDTVQRLNTDKRGTFLGSFGPEDKILTVTQNGQYKLNSFDLSTHFDEDMILIEKFNPNKAVSAIYMDGESKTYFVKRFMIESTDKKVLFISETPGSFVEIVTTDALPVVEVKYSKVKDKEVPSEQIKLTEFIEVKGMKAKGNKLSYSKVKEINLLPPVEIAIDDDVLDEFEESGLSPLEAIKKAQEPAKEKNLRSIDQMINEEIKLPSQEKKKKKKGKDDGKDLKLDF
jgi:topoisomerase-4 subunit A